MEIKNQNMFKRYMRLVEYRKENLVSEGEVHHIIPTCVGGTDDKDNLVKLTFREHYIVHYMLGKIYEEDKLWFAFTMMQRISDGKSRLYELARKHVSEAVRKNNTGKFRSDEFKDRVGKQTKNKVNVKDKQGNIFQTTKDHPKYISGEWVFHRVGYKHNQKTIERMKRNGLCGRKMYHCGKTGKCIFLKNDDVVPEGYVEGAGKTFCNKAKNRKKTTRWYTNVLDGTLKRFGNEDEIPENFVPGRKGMMRGGNGKFIKR